MQFCKECGSKLEDSAKFCKECGTTISEQNHKQPSMSPSPAPVAKQTMTKKKKRQLIAAGIAIVVLFGGYKIGETLTSKDRLIEKFENALIEKDSQKVASLLSSSDKKLEINKDSVSGLMKYLNKNPDLAKEIVSDLRAQSTLIDKSAGKDAKSLYEGFFEDMAGNDLVNLKKDGKFLFYDNYKLDIQSVYLTLKTNYKDTELFVDGKKVGTSNKLDFEKTFGPFVPGLHTAEATLKTKFVALETKDEFRLSSDKQVEDLYLDGRDVTVDLPDTNTGTAKLFINGKDVGVDLFKNPTFGPILTDGSMKMAVEAELPWGKVKTDEVAIDSEEMTVSFVNEELQKNLMETIHKSIDDELEAFTTLDAGKLTTATATYKDEKMEKAKDNKSNGYIYKGSHLNTKFDLDSFHLYHEDGNWIVTVEAEAGYMDDKFYYNETPELEENTTTFEFELYYDKTSNKWLLNNRSDSYGFDDEHVKELKNENPKQYVSSWINDVPAEDVIPMDND
ncbi:zinc ribbon domain-containing protein [Neobacillus vireti]|uniref:Zinc-ribbon domain-containing protein n=1 Tax=Neobacillus vireti LMG 21834 TaxID=1131730 RepID=A0AB94IRK3_9BACI|nr:zinc-ribbon domain-containing protein [Neobacillus vireti]ETI69652.1 hypothetical protein BAVI_06299 [Neobacillus vireti LMG 21834]KLT18243.1 hypothetical protein AA980_07845 [Neobacillus vireti]